MKKIEMASQRSSLPLQPAFFLCDHLRTIKNLKPSHPQLHLHPLALGSHLSSKLCPCHCQDPDAIRSTSRPARDLWLRLLIPEGRVSQLEQLASQGDDFSWWLRLRALGHRHGVPCQPQALQERMTITHIKTLGSMIVRMRACFVAVHKCGI